jgi:hypothetical protein
MPQSHPRTTESGGQPDRRALLQAFKDVVQSEREKKGDEGRPGSQARPIYVVVMSVVLISLIALLVTRPAWLFPRPPEETPAVREASLRVRMYVEIERIEQFRSANGQYPASLLEAGGDTTGLSYTTGPTGYTLTGQNGGITATFAAGSNPREFLGNSYQAIARRRQGE